MTVTTPCDVVLAHMPWASTDTPSLAMGRLARSLRDAGFTTATHYVHLTFAAAIGRDVYATVMNERATMVGEWLFADALFGRSTEQARFAESSVVRASAISPVMLREIHQRIDDLLERSAAAIAAQTPAVVVFPSVSTDVQQHCPSLALARRVKRRLPAATLVFSGNSVEGIMGLETARCFDFIDVIISGDVDAALHLVVEERLRDRLPTDAPGIHRRGHLPSEADDNVLRNTPLLDLETLPSADHADYFAQRDALGLGAGQPRIITFGTSRGCWWAEKNHCTFCSLHGKRPAYRTISKDKAMADLTRAIAANDADLALATDYILNPEAFEDFIPALTAEALPVRIYYEVRPHLTKGQLARLKAAGIDHVQAGIESFSTPLLRRIKKGASCLQHVRFLKWARELGIYVSWNLLCGLPDAEAEDYQASLDLLPSLSHLSPTGHAVEFILQRYSPYFVQRERHYQSVRPFGAYAEMFAELPQESVERIAYNFVGDHPARDLGEHYRRALTTAIEQWRAEHDRSGLFQVTRADEVIVIDLRSVAARTVTRLRGLDAALYAGCDDIRSVSSLQAGALDVSNEEIERRVDELVQDKLMLREGTACLSLAIPLGSTPLHPRQRERLLALPGIGELRDAIG